MAAATSSAFQDFPCCLIFRFCTSWRWRDYAWRPPKQDSGLHLDRLPVSPIRLESPLVQSVSDRPCLIGECAKKMNVLYLAFLVNDDSDRNRVKPMFGKNKVNPCDHVFVANVVLDANGDSAPPPPPLGLASSGNLILFMSRIKRSNSLLSRLVNTICTVWQRI